MTKIIMKVKDDNDQFLEIGDTVMVLCSTIKNSAYYTKFQIFNGRLFPHDFFASAHIRKVDSIPVAAKMIEKEIDGEPDIYVASSDGVEGSEYNPDLSLLMMIRNRKYTMEVED